MNERQKRKRICSLAVVITIFLAVATTQVIPTVKSVDDPPSPLIIAPSILDPEAPRHEETLIVWGRFINLSAIDLRAAEDIQNTTFEYSLNGMDWELIGTSYEGTTKGLEDVYNISYTDSETWNGVWDTISISEGTYYIRATMTDAVGHTGQDNITVYFDPTPPIPEFTLPWGTTVNGEAQVTVNTNAADVLYTQFESLKVSTEYQIPLVGQKNTSCVWNTMASLLQYWANRTDKDGKKPLHKLIENDQGNEMNATQLIDALVAEFKNGLSAEGQAKVDRSKGLYDVWEVQCLRKWLAKKDISNPEKWIPDPKDKSKDGLGFIEFDEIKKEFENGPVMVSIRYSLAPLAKGHSMILKSVNNKPTKESPYPGLVEYRVELMDPYLVQSGKNEHYATTMRGDGNIYMSWGKTFPCDWPTPGWWFVDSKIQLLPPKDILENLDLLASWAPEGTDLDGADGWSLALDTTVLEEGYHFVKATMVDSSGSNGTEITEVFVDNIPPVPGDHDVAITSLEASDTFIAVVVENQGLYNETAYVSVYYRTTDPTKRVDLESGANATLQFEWTPSTGFYAITAEVDRVMDELDTADNILIITTTIITSSSESSSSQPLESNVNMIILGFCLLSASLAVPQLLERKESDFETIALAHKQNLNATTTESVWQNPIGRQYV